MLASLGEQYGLPEGYRVEGEAVKLSDGRTVYQFSRPERVSTGLSHEGADVQVELYSGLSATFDPSGRMLSSFHTPVGAEEVENAALFSADLMGRDRVKTNAFALEEFNPGGNVYLGQLVEDFERPEVKVLQRLPIYD